MLNIVKNLISGIEIVHKTGHILNDVKLDNIMIHKSEGEDDLRVLLIDFGMAHKYTDSDGKHLPTCKT